MILATERIQYASCYGTTGNAYSPAMIYTQVVRTTLIEKYSTPANYPHLKRHF